MNSVGGSGRSERRSLATRLAERLRPLPRTNHVALGTFCHVASALRDAGLRRWTGPFDWIFSSPAMIAECIGDGFAGFLDPAELASVPAAELTNGAARQCRHRGYESRYGLPILFNHHDPVASPSDRRALGRALARMRDAIGTERRNQLYMMSEVRWPAEDVAAVAAALAGRPSGNRLVVITAAGGASAPGHAVRALDGLGCAAIEVDLATRTRTNGLRFPDPADEAHLRAMLKALAADFEAANPAYHS